MSKHNVPRMIELARSHIETGGIRAAEIYYRMIYKATNPPTSGLERVACGEACAFFARVAVAEKMHGHACDWYQRATFADPLCVDYRIEFIVKALLPMGMFKNAKIEATRATKIDPCSKDAWRALGIVCAALGEEKESAAAYDRQLELDPDNPLTRLDRATLAINVGDYETANEMAEPLLDDLDSSDRGEALHTLGLIAYRKGQHEYAINLYEQAIKSGVQDEAQVRWNMSLAMHAIGRYEEGFRESENRGKQVADQAMRLVMNRFTQPALTKEELRTPCRLHVHQEMGNGDAIAMARYLDLLVAIGHDVVLETMDSMVSLFARSFPQVRVIPKAVDYPGAIGIPPFDRHVTTLSLPYLFGTTVKTVPCPSRYLKPNPELVDAYSKRLPAHSKRIGLCWSSGIRTDGLWISRYGKMKSMAFDDLKPLLGMKNACFVSLQVGPERAEHKNRVIDLLPEKPDWDHTAALIDSLDLVITVDTAVAHMAGALGKPVFLMMQKDGSTWHFMCERPGAAWNERSPWYLSMKIFRQREKGIWTGVVDRIVQEMMIDA